MLQLTPHHNIHVAVAAVDFRKGIGGLVALYEQVLAYDPFGGHIFVFRDCEPPLNSWFTMVMDSDWFCQN